jgi:peptidoglycan/LPS O-acetylase OafA/YrhL
MTARGRGTQSALPLKELNTRWLAYTFLVGLIPVLMRSLAWMTTREGRVAAFSPPDLLVFGLVIHISLINELEHVSDVKRNARSAKNGISLTLICIYSALYAVNIIGEKDPGLIHDGAMFTTCAAMMLFSTIFSLKTFQWILGSEK